MKKNFPSCLSGQANLHNAQCLLVHVCVQPHLTLCNPMDCSPQSSSVHGIFQARILEWSPFPTPGDLPHPGIESTSLMSPALAGGFFTLHHLGTWQFIGGKLSTSRWQAGVFLPIISPPNYVFFWKALNWRENNHWLLTGIVLKDSRHTISNSVSHSQRPWLCEFVAAAFRQAKGNQCHWNAVQHSYQKMSFFSKCHIYNFYWSVMTDSE